MLKMYILIQYVEPSRILINLTHNHSWLPISITIQHHKYLHSILSYIMLQKGQNVAILVSHERPWQPEGTYDQPHTFYTDYGLKCGLYKALFSSFLCLQKSHKEKLVIFDLVFVTNCYISVKIVSDKFSRILFDFPNLQGQLVLGT